MTARLARHWPFILAMLAGILLGGLSLIQPQLTALRDAQLAGENWQATLQQNKAAKAAIPEQREALRQWHQMIRDHRVYLPARTDMTELLATVTRTATHARVDIQQITPSSDQRISLVAQGHWPQTMEFLHQLIQQPTALSIKEFAAYPQQTEDHERLTTLEITLAAHSDPNALSVAEKPAHISHELPAALTPNPFLAEAATSVASTLTLPFSYAGQIQVGQTTWALLINEKGSIQRHRIGARFYKGWQLVDVDQKRLLVKSPQGQIHPIALRSPSSQGGS